MEYYILSLKRSTPTNALWWGPEEKGYYEDLRSAGRYSEADVRAKADRLNNGVSTRAIPCGPVDEHARLTVRSDVLGALIKSGARAAGG